MMGQVGDENLDTELLTEKAAKIAKSMEEVIDAVNSVPKISRKLTETYVRIMTLCARFLTLTNAISSKKLSLGESTKKYVSENYSKKVSIKDICQETLLFQG